MIHDDLIYSPTDTENYLRCPRYWQLGDMYEPRGCVYTPNMDIGTAIHAGLAEHYSQVAGHFTKGATTAARDSMMENYQEGGDYTLEACLSLVENGLKVALKTDLTSGGKVLGVELAFPHMRIDLLHEDSSGLTVTDHKVTLKLEKAKLAWRLNDYDPSWQLLQYAWGVRKHMQRTPTWARVFLIALTPKPFTHLHSIPITDKRLDDFEKSATMHWSGMRAHEQIFAEHGELAPMNTRSCHAYGSKCPQYDICHIFHGNLKMADSLYQKKEVKNG